MPPHYRGRCHTNPPTPGDFTRHAEAIQETINTATADFAPRLKRDIFYTVQEDVVDVTIESEDLNEDQARAAFDELVQNEALRLSLDDLRTLHEPEELDRLPQQSQSA